MASSAQVRVELWGAVVVVDSWTGGGLVLMEGSRLDRGGEGDRETAIGVVLWSSPPA